MGCLISGWRIIDVRRFHHSLDDGKIKYLLDRTCRLCTIPTQLTTQFKGINWQTKRRIAEALLLRLCWQTLSARIQVRNRLAVRRNV